MSVLILLLLVAIIIALFVVFTNRKNQILVTAEKEKTQMKNKLQQSFNDELSKSQIEIREETLRHISWELHDNIGQLMTLAKINAQLVKDNPQKINEVTQNISAALQELRALSKSINIDYLKKLSLIEAINLEVDRFNRLDHIKTSLEIKGPVKELNLNKEIILFRILQEFFSNTIKHSKATELNVQLNYSSDSINIKAQDNGIGFNIKDNPSGLGIQNMTNRAKVINATFALFSEPQQGTSIQLEYDFKNENILI